MIKTNFDILIEDKQKLAKVIADSNDPLSEDIVEWYCGNVCRNKKKCDRDGICVNDIPTNKVVEIWFDQKVK